MKKLSKFSKILLSFMLISLSFLSCNLEIEEEDKLSPPTCDADAGNCISFSIKKYNSETQYINIYRKDITDSDTNAPYENIGLIFPKNFPDKEQTNGFKDIFVKNGHSYVYYARIFDGQKYIKTQESYEIKIPSNANCFPDTADFTYNVNQATFTYDSENFTITIDGTITDSTNIPSNRSFTPVVIISSSEKSETFVLPPLVNGTVISLQSILSNDFFNKNIVIEGICGQEIEYDDSNTEIEQESRPIKRIYWTTLTKINLIGSTKNTINVPDSSNNHGYDYSRKLISLQNF